MRKRNKGRILSRPKSQRKTLLKALATGLFLHERMVTTEAKAKELRPVAESMITQAKHGGAHQLRQIGSVLAPSVAKKLTQDIAPRFAKRQGGYTRITHMGPRKSDGARMVIIELVK